MDAHPSSAPPASADQELAQLTQRVEAMRAVLVRLLQDVVRAESFLDQNQSVQLLEANEQLVLTALGAQQASELALSPAGASAAPAAIKRQSVEVAQLLAKQEKKHLLLQEANEQLVLATLSAMDLQTAAAAAEQRQADFMAGVAAELNDATSPIRIAMAMLGRPSDAAPLLPHAQEMMAQQAAQIRGFVSDLLHPVDAAARAKLRLTLRTLDLAALLDHCAQLCRPQLDKRQQRLICALPPEPLHLPGDAMRLTQVVSNLLSNASRYSHDGGVIQMSVLRLDSHAVISVSDAGIGIPAQALKTIFEPFGQEAHAVGVQGGGLGLGLTVVREIIEAHGGSVRACSAGVGLGSQFFVTLPLAT